MTAYTRYGTGYKDPASVNRINAVYADAQNRSVNSMISIGASDGIGSVYYVGQVPSNAIIDPASTFYFEAATDVTDFDLGFANDPDALVDGLDIHLAGSDRVMKSVATASLNKRAWELAGLSSDPGGMLDIIATLKAAASAAAKVVFRINYGRL